MFTSIESVSKGVDLAFKNPIIFVPAAAPIVVELIFDLAARLAFPWKYVLGVYYGPAILYPFLTGLISMIVGFLAGCMVIDMVNDALSNRLISFSKSLRVVINRIVDLAIAAIIAGILALTIILIPISFFIVTIAIVDDLDAVESAKHSLSFVLRNLGEVILFIVIVIIAVAICSIIPFIGFVLRWLAGVVFMASTVYFYKTLSA